MATIKMCQQDMFYFYLALEIAFWVDNLQTFDDIFHNRSALLSLKWITNLNLAEKMLAFVLEIGDLLPTL